MRIEFTLDELTDLLGEWCDMRGIAEDAEHHMVSLRLRPDACRVIYSTDEDCDRLL